MKRFLFLQCRCPWIGTPGAAGKQHGTNDVDCSVDTDDQVEGETETAANAVFTRRQTAAAESGRLDDDAETGQYGGILLRMRSKL